MKKFHIYKDENQKESLVLRKRAVPIMLPLNSDQKQIAEEMIEYVEMGKNERLAEEQGVVSSYGIAAPQIGHSLRMFYISVEKSFNSISHKNESEESLKIFLINPKLVSYQNIYGGLKNGESCLSVDKEYVGFVKRSISIVVKGYDYLKKEDVTIEAKGKLAIVIQHELDHLNGVLYYDRIVCSPQELKNEAKNNGWELY